MLRELFELGGWGVLLAAATLASAGIMAAAAGWLWTSGLLWLLAAACLPLVYMAVQSWLILGHLPEKIRLRDTIVMRNQPGFREDTLLTYMRSPCGRALARSALRRLDRPLSWKQLKQHYRLSKKNGTLSETGGAVVFRTHQEESDGKQFG